MTLIDENAALLNDVANTLDVKGIVGHAAHPAVLARADATNADILVAVTYSDEINMVACHVAKVMFDTPRCVARIRSQAYLQPEAKVLLKSERGLRVDAIISPETEVAESVLQRLEVPGAFLSARVVDKAASLLGVEVNSASPVVGHPVGRLGSLFPDLRAEVVAIGRGSRLFAPTDYDAPDAGDRLYITVPATEVSRTINILGRAELPGQRIIIVGGGNIGVAVAQALETRPGVRVRLIESNRARAELAAAKLSRAIVIVGDGLSANTLREAGIDDTNAVVALTNDDRSNVLLSILARELGVKRTLSLINSAELIGLKSIIGVDSVIDPRGLTVSRVLLHLRRGRILGLHSLEDGAGEVMEGLVMPTSGLVGTSIATEKRIDGVRVGLVYRQGNPEALSRNERIRENDRVVLFSERGSRKEVERFFRVSAYY